MGSFTGTSMTVHSAYIWYENIFTLRYRLVESKMQYVHTLPTAEILSGKNARAWVSMVLYLKKKKIIETKR